MTSCAWCARRFAPNAFGRPRTYCSPECRREHGNHAAGLPVWTARIVELEKAAALYRGGTPVFIADELAALRALINRRPAGLPSTGTRRPQ